MATVQKRGPYQWRVQIRKKGHPPQTRTFDVRSEADAWARQVEGEMDRGLFVSRKEAENTTLSEARDRYEREVSSQKRSSDQDRIYVRYWKKMALAARNLASNVEHVIICFELYAKDFLRPSSLYLYSLMRYTVTHE